MKTAFKIVLIIILAVGICNVCLSGELSDTEIDVQFKEANDLFHSGNQASGDEAVRLYDQAILRYERIVNEGGIKNAGLYYNLANAYLLKGDLGRAILNYRRSELLDESNPDLQKNLSFARSRRMDQIDTATKKKVLQTLFFWHYAFPVKIRFFLACMFFAVGFLTLTAIVWFGRRGPMAAVCVVCGVLVLSFALSVTVETLGKSGCKSGVIVSESVVARTGDGRNYPKSFKDPLHAGTEFDLVKKQSGWFNIRLADGSSGWVPKGTAELVKN